MFGIVEVSRNDMEKLDFGVIARIDFISKLFDIDWAIYEKEGSLGVI